MSTESAVHPWDEGAQEPTNKQVIVSAVIAWFWLGIAATPLVPLGLVINLFRLGSLTGANTLAGRLRFGKKVVVVSLAAAALGFLVRAGLYLGKGSFRIHFF